MHWSDTPDAVLKQSGACLGPARRDGLALHAQWLETLTADETDRLRHLLQDAYATPAMWEDYREDIFAPAPPKRLVFSLRDIVTGEWIATRSIGEAAWGEEYWDAHAAALKQNPPLAGMALTVARNARGKGLGAQFWQDTTDWIRRHSSIEALFGDTLSARALAMYRRRGAWFFGPDVDEMCRRHGTSDLRALEENVAGEERLRGGTGAPLRYVWPFTPRAGAQLTRLGYRPED